MRCCHVTRIYDHPAKQFARIDFFGRYAGTVISNGFYWVNPLFLKSTVTLRILNLNIDPIKVNDKVGNPIMIGAVVVWRIKDTYKASFDISGNIREFVQIQSDAALRQVAGMYAYDTNETIDKVTPVPMKAEK